MLSGLEKQAERGALLALVVAIFFAPLAYGSVHPWTAFVGLALAGVAFTASLVRRSVSDRNSSAGYRRGLLWVPPALLLWEALGMLPLPPWLLAAISEHSAELQRFSLSTLGGELGWRPLSLDAPATALVVVRHSSFLLILFAGLRLSEDRTTRRKLSTALGALGGTLVLLAVLHRLGGYSTIYEFLGEGLRLPTKPGGWLFSSFVNPNHFAALLTLLTPVCLGLALSSRGGGRGTHDGAQIVVWGGVAFGAGFACVLTLSRGGMLGLSLGIAAFVYLIWRQRFRLLTQRDREEAERRPAHLRPATLIFLGISALTGIFMLAGSVALEPILQELSSLSPAAVMNTETRFKLWSELLTLVPDYWLSGSGAGSFAFVYPLVRHLGGSNTYVFAESQPLQSILELGVVQAVAGMAFLSVVVWKGAKHAHSPRSAGLCAGLIGLGFHDLADFSTSFGGVAMPAALALGLILRKSLRPQALLSQGDAAESKRGPGLLLLLRKLHARVSPRGSPPLPLSDRALIGGLGFLALLLALLALPVAWGHQADQELASIQRTALPLADSLEALSAMQRRHPADHMVGLVAGRRLLKAGQPKRALAWLGHSMLLSPRDPMPHLLTGMALAQVSPDARQQALLEFKLAGEHGEDPTRLLEVVDQFGPSLTELMSVLPLNPRGQVAGLQFLLRKKRHDEAMGLALSLVERWPEDEIVLLSSARCARASARPKEALLISERLLALRPAAWTGYYEQGHALRGLGREEEAAEAFKRGLMHVPGQLSLSLSLAGAQLRSGSPEQGLQTLDRAHLLGPDHSLAEYHLLRADLLIELGELDAASSALRRAQLLFPEWEALASRRAKIEERIEARERGR